jgi:PAT family beta-lactamase induction signal transducer AmpG
MSAARPERRILWWVALLYVGQGLPYGVTARVLPVYFRVHGVSLAEIGLLSLIALPWTWKPLWAPLVDRFGSRRAWIVPCLAFLAVAVGALGLLPANPIALPLVLLLVAFAFASATQDLALDAWAIDVVASRSESGVPSNRLLGSLNGVRSGTFRVAMILAGSGALLVAGAADWTTAWLALAALFAVLAVAALFLPEAAREARAPGSRADLGASTERRADLGALWRWLARREMALVVVFLLLYKLGDQALNRMIEPFWVDRGMTLAEIALAANTLGLGLSAAGALLGGWFVARRGTFSGLVWLGVAQAASNLAYFSVAAFALPRESIYVASAIEYFTQGMGSAALLALMTLLCDRAHAATQYALLSALVAFSRDLAGALSGFGAERFGYAGFFALTVALALPGLALLPWLAPKVALLEGRAAAPS